MAGKQVFTIEKLEIMKAWWSFNDKRREILAFTKSIEVLSEEGMAYKTWVDLSDQLPLNFAAMHATVEREREEMLKAGVEIGMIERFAQNLPPRVKMAERGAFAWGVFAFKKPAAGEDMPDKRGSCTIS